MRLIFAACLWLLTVPPSAAQDVATADRLVSAFTGWVSTHDIKKGAISVAYKGAPVRQAGIGIDAQAPMEMASLSKAITAACVVRLVDEGVLGYDTYFDQLIGRGPHVSVAQLLSHSGGLFPDRTQGAMWLWARMGHLNDASGAVLDGIIAADEPIQNQGRYQYNNENYALLGVMIAQASATSYRDACTQRVLAPLGIVASPSPITDKFLAWGGWRISVADYGRFLTHWFGTDSAAGRDPFARPHVQVGGGAHYGQGMFFREFRGSYNFWHHGAWCFPAQLQSGSFAVSWQSEWSVVVAYTHCPDWDMMLELDTVLSKAVFQ
jgi:CubicO group peptidase (beta-lactamase class C family)